MKLWKQRLFSRLQRPDEGDGSDLGGEVISINGEGATPPTDGTDTTAEDRGDVVTPPSADKGDGETSTQDSTATEPKSGGIPKARFDEVNERRKSAEQELEAARAELAALKSGKQAAPTQTTEQTPQEPAAEQFDEDAKEQAYIDAMLDGDTALAKQIRKEINANLRQQAAVEVETRTTQRNAAESLSQAAAKASTDYPYLDTDEGSYALGLIVSARDAGIARGLPAHVALADAVAKIAPRFAPADSAATPSRGLPTPKAAVDTRTQQALERGALDSTRQPPPMQAGLGNRTDKVRIDVDNLDEAQFAALTPAEKKAARGDYS